MRHSYEQCETGGISYKATSVLSILLLLEGFRNSDGIDDPSVIIFVFMSVFMYV